MNDSSLFILWPYAALALLVVGTAFRYVLARRRPDLLAAEMSEAKAVFGGKIFWFSMVLLIVAHLVGLLLPRALLNWNASPARLYLLEGLGFALGLAAAVTGFILVWKHLGRSGHSLLAEICDTVFLALLLVVVVSGLLVAMKYRWGSSWGAMILTPYVVSVLRGTPALNFITELQPLVKLHVLSTVAAVAVIPLTRLSTLVVSVLHISVGLAGWPFAAAGRAAERWIRKHNPSAWFWPEED